MWLACKLATTCMQAWTNGQNVLKNWPKLVPTLGNLKGTQNFCFENDKHEWQDSTINRGAIVH